MRSRIRDIFARALRNHLADEDLSDEVQLIFENIQLAPKVGTKSWIELKFSFSQDISAGAYDNSLLGRQLLQGQLFGIAGVPLGSGVQMLDRVIASLDSALSHHRSSTLVSFQMNSTEPFIRSIYHCVGYSMNFSACSDEV